MLRTIFGIFFFLFIPRFAWSFIFFNREEIDWIERVALSFGLSIALVPLTVFYLNFIFKLGIALMDVTITILILVSIPTMYLFLAKYFKRKSLK